MNAMFDINHVALSLLTARDGAERLSIGSWTTIEKLTVQVQRIDNCGHNPFLKSSTGINHWVVHL